MVTSTEDRVNDVNRAIKWVNNLFKNEEQYGENWRRYSRRCNIGGDKDFSFLFAYNSSLIAIIINSTVYFAWEDDGSFCLYGKNPFSISTAFMSDMIDLLNKLQEALPRLGEPIMFSGTNNICHFGFDSNIKC